MRLIKIPLTHNQKNGILEAIKGCVRMETVFKEDVSFSVFYFWSELVTIRQTSKEKGWYERKYIHVTKDIAKIIAQVFLNKHSQSLSIEHFDYARSIIIYKKAGVVLTQKQPRGQMTTVTMSQRTATGLAKFVLENCV